MGGTQLGEISRSKRSPKRHFWRAAGIALGIPVLGLLATWLGVMVGSGSPATDPDSSQVCDLPASTTVTQVISFPNNQPASAVQDTVTVTLPSSDQYASVLAGQSAPRNEHLAYYQCLFNYLPASPVTITQKDQTTSFAIQANYLGPGILQSPTVTAQGLQLSAPTYASSPGLDNWPEGTYVTLQVKAPGRDLVYSQPNTA